MTKKLWYILIPIALLVFLGMGAIGQYNGLVESQTEVETARANVDTQLQRRYDLIPNVVSAVKGAMAHETEVFTAIADARSKIGSASRNSEEYKAAQTQLDSAVSRLLVLTENYPQLNSNQQVSELITELEGTENRILVADSNNHHSRSEPDPPPRSGFADKWHRQILQEMPDIELTVLIGQYAQHYYLKQQKSVKVTDNVRHFQDFLPDYFPLVHPSPRNNSWQAKNPWFKEEVLPVLKERVAAILSR